MLTYVFILFIYLFITVGDLGPGGGGFTSDAAVVQHDHEKGGDILVLAESRQVIQVGGYNPPSSLQHLEGMDIIHPSLSSMSFCLKKFFEIDPSGKEIPV